MRRGRFFTCVSTRPQMFSEKREEKSQWTLFCLLLSLEEPTSSQAGSDYVYIIAVTWLTLTHIHICISLYYYTWQLKKQREWITSKTFWWLRCTKSRRYFLKRTLRKTFSVTLYRCKTSYFLCFIDYHYLLVPK